MSTPVTISISTIADTSGLKKTDAALEEVQDTAQDVTAAMQRSTAEFAAMTDKAKVSTFAFYDLDAALKKTGSKTEDLEPSTRKVTSGMANMRMGVQNASYQMADFAVQVGGGVSATRALSQQLPQLLGGFGMWGAVAGAAVAVVGGLFEAMTKGGVSAEEQAKKTTEAIGKVVDVFKGVTTENLERAETKIESQRARVEATRQTWNETNKAQADYATATLTNSGKIATAQQTIAEWLGQQVAAYQYMKAEMERQAQIRTAAAERELAAEAKRLEAAQRTADEAQRLLETKSLLTEKAQKDLLTSEKELEVLRAKKDALQKIVSDPQNKAISDDPGIGVLQSIGIGIKPLGYTPEQRKAKKQLGAMDFQAELATKEQEVDELREAIKKATADGGTLDKARTAMLAASTRLDDVEKSVEIGTQTILDSLAADTTVAKINDAVSVGKQFATDIDKALEQVKPANDAASQNLSGLAALTADGQIIATEQREAQDRLRTLTGQIQSGQASFTGNLGTVIAWMSNYQRDMATMTSAVAKLQADYRATSARLNQIR